MKTLSPLFYEDFGLFQKKNATLQTDPVAAPLPKGQGHLDDIYHNPAHSKF